MQKRQRKRFYFIKITGAIRTIKRVLYYHLIDCDYDYQ